MSEWDKNLNAETFEKLQSENTKYIILMATDTYRMDINNPVVGLVIQ